MKKTINILCIIMMMFSFLSIKTNAIDVSNVEITEQSGQLSVKGVAAVTDDASTKESQEEYLYGEDGKSGKMGNYITVIAFITAIATITMIAIFIKNVIHFGALGTEHWIVRRNAMFGLLWSAIATALLGSATLILALSYNAFQL